VTPGVLGLLGAALLLAPGCAMLPTAVRDNYGHERGKLFFIGGAGPIGTVVGRQDVPVGLRLGRYDGAIEVFPWQAPVGGTLRDQTDRRRNQGQAYRLAQRIIEYQDAHPGRPVNIIALSAGTGIAAWAIEALPDNHRVQTVVFLASSLSRDYDLTGVLKHLDGRLYSFASARDPVLRYVVPVAGSVDRQFGFGQAAGLYGFTPPQGADVHIRRLYRQRLRNRAYRSSYARYGYRGQHTDATELRFVQHVVAPLLVDPITDAPRPYQADIPDPPEQPEALTPSVAPAS
jgi:hypothetical protein